MSLLSRIAERTVVAAANWALAKLFGPPKPGRPRKRAPGELDSADVAIQNRASHVPEEHKVVPPRRSSSRYDD